MKKIPPRVAQRSDAGLWSPTEMMSLAEAAALFFPDGYPLSLNSLRTAVRDNQLAVVVIGNKFLTNKASIIAMTECRLGAAAAPRPQQKTETMGRSLALRKLSEAR
jgi:hypothetical protein